MRQVMQNCGKPLVLTFDDGPDERYTGQLLDLLGEEQVPAAFFVVGNHAKANPGLIRRMEAEGHTVGSHSLSHKNALLASYRQTRADFEACREIHRALLGRPPRYFRPPWGMRNPFTVRMVRSHDMTMVLWDVMIQDWRADATTVGLIRKLKARAFPGAVLCLHDAGEDTGGAPGAPAKTIRALREAIPLLREAGFSFITLEEYFYRKACQAFQGSSMEGGIR